MVMFIIMGATALITLLFGYYIRRGKTNFNVAGQKIDNLEEPFRSTILKRLANHFIRLACYFALIGLAFFISNILFIAIFVSLSIMDMLFTVYKTIVSMNNKHRRVAQATTAIAAVFFIIIAGIIAIVYHSGERDPRIVVQDDDIQIDCMYGISFPVADVEFVSLIDMSMQEIGIGTRKNGYNGLGGTLRGHFISEAKHACILYVNAFSSPTILIKRSQGEDIYISCRNTDDTKKLFQVIMAALE
jgi:hypothetical protein